MAQVQTITITDTSGTTHGTAEALLTQMGTEVDSSTQVAFFETCEAEGTLRITSMDLSEDGATATITRNWSDARWADFAAHTTPGFSAAGWTVVSEDTLVPRGLTTRMDTFVDGDELA